VPLAIGVALPIGIVLFTNDFTALAGLYAIGVIGAITVNLGTCTLNKRLPVRWWERLLLGSTFVVLLIVEITLAKTKPDALFFVLCVLGIGLCLCAYAHKLSGLRTVTISRHVAEMVSTDAIELLRPTAHEGERILVAAARITPALKFALDEAQFRKGALYVLYIKEIAVFLTAALTAGKPACWQDDPEAAALLDVMRKQGHERGVTVLPLYAMSDNPAATILDMAATLGVDLVILGESHRGALAHLLKGDVAGQVATHLPEEIALVIYG